MGLCFWKKGVKLEGFVDADLSGDIDTSKSTSGYVSTVGDTAASWISKYISVSLYLLDSPSICGYIGGGKGDGVAYWFFYLMR